jgi:ribonuclease HI
MWVTLYTDAGFTTYGTYGIWARSELGRIIENGQCPDEVTLSNVAETYAILHGVRRILQEWPTTSAILIRSDCQYALKLWKPAPRTPVVQKYRDEFKVLTRNLQIRIKWIKGHQEVRDIPTYLNNQCDSMARVARIK